MASGAIAGEAGAEDVLRRLRELYRRWSNQHFTPPRRRFSDVGELERSLEPGDHVFAVRKPLSRFAFCHHGIYVGEGRVVHFAPESRGRAWTSEVRCDSVGGFVGESPASDVGVVHYGQGCCTDRRCRWPELGCTAALPAAAHRPGANAPACLRGRAPLAAEEVVRRAREKLDAPRDAPYQLLSYNCEHLAVECKLGEGRQGSAQADAVVEMGVAVEELVASYLGVRVGHAVGGTRRARGGAGGRDSRGQWAGGSRRATPHALAPIAPCPPAVSQPGRPPLTRIPAQRMTGCPMRSASWARRSRRWRPCATSPSSWPEPSSTTALPRATETSARHSS